MFIIDVGDGLLEEVDLFFHQGLEVGFVSTDGDTCEFFVLVAFLEGHHHAEVFPGSFQRYFRWELRDWR